VNAASKAGAAVEVEGSAEARGSAEVEAQLPLGGRPAADGASEATAVLLWVVVLLPLAAEVGGGERTRSSRQRHSPLI